MRLRIFLLSLAIIGLVLPNANAFTPVKMERIPIVLGELLKNKSLANPAMVIIDLKTGQVILNKDGNTPRKPASTLKLVSVMAILDYLPENQTFTTAIYKTDLKNTFQILGDFDPSITPSARLAKSDGFIWSGTLINKIRSEAKSKSLTIRYHGLTSRSRINMSNDFRRLGYRITWKSITLEESNQHLTEKVSLLTSPPLSKIIHHTLLWSDNFVADYLAQLAAKEAGFGFSESGINSVFYESMTRNNIENVAMKVEDGSGLSHKNKISAMTLAQVLLKFYSDTKFRIAIDGLPIGGVSGTLQNRFITTSPRSIGLVRAKTGSIRGVVSLAGYVDSAEHQYVFVILADRVGQYYAAESAARAAIDRILGKIAAPLTILDGLNPMSEIKDTDTNPINS